MLRRIFMSVAMAVVFGLVFYTLNTLSGDTNSSVSVTTNVIETAVAFAAGAFIGSD